VTKKYRPHFFLPIILALVFTGGLSAQEDAWYKSNSIGTLIESINDTDTNGLEYVLHVRTDGEQETRTLFDVDGLEVRRWERLYSETGFLEEEAVFVEEVKDSLTTYYPSGLVREEVLFTNGRESGRFLFDYPSRESPLTESQGEADAQTSSSSASSMGYKKMAPLSVSFSRPTAAGFRDEYQYLPSGDFRGIKRIYDDGAVYASVFNLDKGILREEWHSFGDMEILFHYDKRGNVLYTEEYRASVLEERSDFRYDTEAPFRLREKTTRDAATGREVLLEYGDDGNPLRESVLEGGSRVSVTRFTYKDNLLIRKETRQRNGQEEWEYFYDEDKDLVRENYLREGKMTMVRYYEPEAPEGTEEEYSRIDEYFRNEEMFLRLYFKDGEEVKREIPGEEPFL
jgi:antitoxin component YwqK of YwqJK toxin-antitoxin module